MKLPRELQPGDKFYFQYSIGEELKLWKVWAVGPHSLIASSENLYVKVPIFYKHLENPEGHFCYVPHAPALWNNSGLRCHSNQRPNRKVYLNQKEAGDNWLRNRSTACPSETGLLQIIKVIR